MDFETYNMGHLMTCACVHYRATGKTSLLDIARKATDYLYKLYKTSPETVTNNAICPSQKFSSHFLPKLLGGITVLKGQALRLPGGNWDTTLYREISHETPDPIDIRLIPYYAWGNRGDSEMTVWMPLR